ncbi:hypothetical protein RRG08_010772 [Elysia crispata]|uniref:Uncharacterized protein n=1 Tax=Elysia crispata TaxID=231223 RepID=A0AAE1DRQ8_9GAST|nr:hypothetical protein RRG08_010772 [Elysia crispata]
MVRVTLLEPIDFFSGCRSVIALLEKAGPKGGRFYDATARLIAGFLIRADTVRLESSEETSDLSYSGPPPLGISTVL